MYEVTRDGNVTQIESGSRFVQVGSIFFMAIGLFDLVAGFFSNDPVALLGPGIGALVVGITYAFVPYQTVLKIDRATGDFTRTAKAVFRTVNDNAKLAELESIVIVPGTYYWFFEVTRKDGGRVRLFGQMKMTWTWTMTPSPDVVARAQEVAGAIGVSLKS